MAEEKRLDTEGDTYGRSYRREKERFLPGTAQWPDRSEVRSNDGSMIGAMA